MRRSESSRSPETSASAGEEGTVLELARSLLNKIMRGELATSPTEERLACIPRATEVLVTAAQLGHVRDAQSEASESNPSLTDRKKEILELLAEGKCSKEIAKELYISERTVNNHVYALCKAFGTRTRLEAIKKAKRVGYL